MALCREGIGVRLRTPCHFASMKPSLTCHFVTVKPSLDPRGNARRAEGAKREGVSDLPLRPLEGISRSDLTDEHGETGAPERTGLLSSANASKPAGAGFDPR